MITLILQLKEKEKKQRFLIEAIDIGTKVAEWMVHQESNLGSIPSQGRIYYGSGSTQPHQN